MNRTHRISLAKLGICLGLISALVMGCINGSLPTSTGTPEPTPSMNTNASPGTVIPFQEFPTGIFYSYYFRTEQSAFIWIITDSHQYSRPKGIDWKSNDIQEPPPEIEEFDFTKYFILLAFNGFRGNQGTGFKIKGLWQDKDEININAHFDDPSFGETVLPIWSSQYRALRIDKDNLTQTGKIIFTLLDEKEKVRAKVPVEIP